MSAKESETREVVDRWFGALGRHDGAAALQILAEDVVWTNGPAVPGLSDVIPWLGIFRSRDEVAASFVVWAKNSEVKTFEVRDLFFKDDQVLAIVHERALIKPTGKYYDFEFVQRITVRDGHIARWQSYWDTAQGIEAFTPDA